MRDGEEREKTTRDNESGERKEIIREREMTEDNEK
jgi:hypothetical protein